MTSDEYYQRYLNFQTALEQTRLVALGAAVALEEFPKNLPGSLSEQVGSVLLDFAREWVDAYKAMTAPGEFLIKPRLDAIPAEYRPLAQSAVNSALTYWLSMRASGTERSPFPDFRSIIYAQELVMHLAHLDGFLADSVRAMCFAKPEVLCRDKLISWEKVIKARSYEALVTHLIEDYVRLVDAEGSARERIEYLKSTHGLAIPTAAADLEAISQGEQIRHLVVHNASRVSADYLKRTGRTEVQIGDLVSIQHDFAQDIAASVRTLAGDVYHAITTKYF